MHFMCSVDENGTYVYIFVELASSLMLLDKSIIAA